jgi:hypothetical protein
MSVFSAHSLKTAKRLEAKLQPRVNFYDLSCKPMKLGVLNGNADTVFALRRMEASGPAFCTLGPLLLF